MNSLSFLLAPLALLAPAAVGWHAFESEARAAPEEVEPPLAPGPEAAPVARMVEALREMPQQNQVRIEQRVIIRISPSPRSASDQMMSNLPRRPLPGRYQEERVGGCVPIDGIVGVQPAENRLLLFMRDRRVLSVALERSCSAREFYSGFYVERGSDGQLCSRRDKLQSRSGASCEVAQFSRLVAIRD